MQTQSRKIIKKCVTDPDTGKVYSGYDSADCAPFVLDADKIELHSLDKRTITLPYSGPVPVEFEGAENPRIHFVVRPDCVSVVLFADKHGKKLHAGLEATPKEIDNVLFRFFCREGKSHNTYLTRFDNDIEKFWLGYFHAQYDMWHKIMFEGGATSIAVNLPDDKRTGLLKFLQLMEWELAESATA